MLRIGFAGTFAANLAEPVRARLAVPCDVVVDDERAIVAHLAEMDALVTMVFTAEMAGAARRLKLVQVPGAGLDRIDRAAVPAAAWLANAYGHDVGIAEHAIGAMLALTREFARLDAALREGRWESQWAFSPPSRSLWPELAGKTLGIVGHGRIGQALARRAKAFDMIVLAVRRDPAKSGPRPADVDLLGGPDALDEVLRRADYLAVTSLTEATRGLIGERELGLMKPGAFLVNVARAEIVQEDALYRALAGRRLTGAALDVWYRYPGAAGTFPASRPFHELPNVLMTPHTSGSTEGMMEARARVIAENIGRASRNEPPVNLLQTGPSIP